MTRYDVDISNFSFLDISLALCVGITIHDVLQKAIRMLYCQRNQTTEAIRISQIRVDDDVKDDDDGRVPQYCYPYFRKAATMAFLLSTILRPTLYRNLLSYNMQQGLV